MREDHARTAQPRGIDHDRAHGQPDRVRIAIIPFDMEATGCGIDVCYPEPLSRIASGVETISKEAACGFMAVEEGGMLGPLKPHASKYGVPGFAHNRTKSDPDLEMPPTLAGRRRCAS